MTVDYCVGSVECIQILVNVMKNERKLSHSGQLDYLNPIYYLDLPKSILLAPAEISA